MVIAGAIALGLIVYLTVSNLFLEQEEEKFRVWDIQAANITAFACICLTIKKVV